ncbi:aspartyl protease family protein [Oceanihabitans sediminis]|uniref:aspartyl protease family protein n=1 Tax=Oceanihabitans sediminis TaxID=1812012 RepID=UPI000930631E|nr:aspartyl protease family protein [Oceanihabitans sediminis]MDX1773831.1 aspartyl protease family protein [Oceanihabitans sediminis]
MKKVVFVLICLFILPLEILSQGNFIIQNKRKSDKIRFQLINNLMIIPVKVNGVEMSFILDTGVSKTILFNIFNLEETLNIKNAQEIAIRGLGEGASVEALHSKNNIVEIGEALNINQELYVVYNSNLNFAPRLGIPIHGIIGYDFFKDFVVEIYYSSKSLKFHEPEKYKYSNCKKCESVLLDFHNKKPYITVLVTIDGREIPVKLLIDSGGSDSLWLFEDAELGLIPSDNNFTDFLGYGLSGSVYGKRTRLKSLSINNFVLENVNVAFPEDASILFAKQHEARNGSLAGNILKRFHVVLDYEKSLIRLKKNRFFKEHFSYNKSGIELEQNGIRLVAEKNSISRLLSLDDGNEVVKKGDSRVVYETNYKLSVKPAFTIIELRKDSPAERAGLEVGDIILKINNKESFQFSLQELTHYFYGKEGDRIRLKVERLGEILDFEFKLESLL